MNWAMLLEKLNAKPIRDSSCSEQDSDIGIDVESLPVLQPNLPFDGSHGDDDACDTADSVWKDTPAADPFGMSSPSYQRDEMNSSDDSSLDNDDNLFEYLDWYWRNQGKRQLVVNQLEDSPSYTRDAFFANVHATLASNCTPRMYDGLRDPKTYALESPRQYSKTLEVQNYPAPPPESPRSRMSQGSIRHSRDQRDHGYERFTSSYGGELMERRMDQESPCLPGHPKNENWFNQRMKMERDLSYPQSEFVDYEVPYGQDADFAQCYLSPNNCRAYDKKKSHPSPTAAASKSDTSLMTPKRRFRQKESVY